MLDALLGNRTAADTLMYVAFNRDAYAKEISDRLEITLSLVQAQLRRLEAGGVLVSRPRGRMRFYSFNPHSPYSKPIVEILEMAVDFLSPTEKQKFIIRRRPRAQGKPL